jgi:hypothetical protein
MLSGMLFVHWSLSDLHLAAPRLESPHSRLERVAAARVCITDGSMVESEGVRILQA